MIPVRSRLVVALVLVFLLTGCVSGGADTSSNDQTGTDVPSVEWLTTVDSIDVHGDEIAVIHDERHGTYCYTLNDYDGDATDCVDAGLVEATGQGGLHIVGETTVSGDAYTVIVDEPRGIVCYALNDYAGDGLSCEPLTPPEEDY